MEQLLHKIAHQLDSIDEASLMSLWEKYSKIVARFEPTRRWEESTLIFAFLQAKRWKNQAFNHHWSKQRHPQENTVPFSFSLEEDGGSQSETPKRASVLRFQPQKTDDKHDSE